MATMASAARDIPKASASARDNLTVVAGGRSVPVTRPHSHPGGHHHAGSAPGAAPLPTPPNSISPSLPPHGGLHAALQKAGRAGATTTLESIDSDLDLHGGRGDDHDADDGLGSPTLDSMAGAITPALLAAHHLPGILLAHGPLAIRHIMGYLTTSVPGFAGIPPAKARRLVVGALESRAGQAVAAAHVAAGDAADVEFEKVGWGRWDARRRGQPARNKATGAASADSPPSSEASGASDELEESYRGGGRRRGAIPIGRDGGGANGVGAASVAATGGGQRLLRLPSAATAHGSSGGDDGDSAAFSHDDRELGGLLMMAGTLGGGGGNGGGGGVGVGGARGDDDRMSLDDDDRASSLGASASCSEAPDASDDVVMNDDPEDATDDEDWAAVGAAALRAASYGTRGADRRVMSSSARVYSAAGTSSVFSFSGSKAGAPGARSFSAKMNNSNNNNNTFLRGSQPPTAPRPLNLDFSAIGAATSDAQEREAIEALLRLGSV